jgi:hypothetical protein
MTPLQNDPQQHQRNAKEQKGHLPRGWKRSPDSDSQRNVLQKSSLDSKFGPQNINVTSNSGAGTTAGAPTCTRVRPRRFQSTTETLSRTGSDRMPRTSNGPVAK